MMRRHRAGRHGRPSVRLRRRVGLERNELRRRVDRVQRLAALCLLAVLLAAAPPLAAWSAGWSYRQGTRAERAERADRHQVAATVLAAGGVPAGDRYIHETVRGQWPGPGGGLRTGELPSWKNAVPGAQRRIWVDREGEPTVRPRSHGRTVTDAAYAGLAGVLVAGAPLLLAYWAVRRRCDRHRDALWDAAWARMDADAGRNRPS